MHLRLLTLIGLFLCAGLAAQAQNGDEPAAQHRTREELRELLGPIALYPDPLISLILPASTVPSDVVLAARFVKSGGDPEAAQDKSWDPSVKSLVRYPDTLTWMDENLEWTTQVGDAFVDQPVDVMETVQELRGKARDLGNLVDTPQQRVVEDEEAIRIVPAQPEYIYEPRYDPQVVYYDRPAAEPLLYFGAPLLVGSWLSYDCDWHRHHLYRGEWHDGWDYRHSHDRRDREHIYINNSLANVVQWHVDSKRRHEEVRRPANHGVVGKGKPIVVRPTSIIDHVKHHEGEVRRAEPVGGGRTTPLMGSGKPGDKHEKGDRGGKGKFTLPTTPAPVVHGDGKPHSDSKNGSDKTHTDPVKPHSDRPTPKGDPAKPHIEMPKSKGEDPRPHGDTPKTHFDAPKPKGDPPKPHSDSPKPKGDSPKPHFDAPKPKNDSPKPHFDAPKPKAEAPKPKSSPPKPKSDPPKSSPPKPKSEPPKPKSSPKPDSSHDGKKKDKDKKN